MADLDPESEELLLTAVGDVLDTKRDFVQEPLTQEEIHAVIITLNSELKRKDLHPEIAYLYANVINFLKPKAIYQ